MRSLAERVRSLGGSEVVLLSWAGAARCAPMGVQVVPGKNGPLRERRGCRRQATWSQCPRVARVGESAALAAWTRVQRARLACGRRGGCDDWYEALARTRRIQQTHHTNGFKAHVLGARVRLPHSPGGHRTNTSRAGVTRWLLRSYAGACDAIVANSASVEDDVASIFDTPRPFTSSATPWISMVTPGETRRSRRMAGSHGRRRRHTRRPRRDLRALEGAGEFLERSACPASRTSAGHHRRACV